MVRRFLIVLLALLIPMGMMTEAKAGLFSKKRLTLSQRAAKDAKSAKKAKKAKRAPGQKGRRGWFIF